MDMPRRIRVKKEAVLVTERSEYEVGFDPAAEGADASVSVAVDSSAVSPAIARLTSAFSGLTSLIADGATSTFRAAVTNAQPTPQASPTTPSAAGGGSRGGFVTTGTAGTPVSAGEALGWHAGSGGGGAGGMFIGPGGGGRYSGAGSPGVGYSREELTSYGRSSSSQGDTYSFSLATEADVTRRTYEVTLYVYRSGNVFQAFRTSVAQEVVEDGTPLHLRDMIVNSFARSLATLFSEELVTLLERDSNFARLSSRTRT